MLSKDTFGDIAKEKGEQILQAIEKSARTTFPILNNFEGNYLPGSAYSIVRHTRAWVYYQGVSTVVPVSILGQGPVPTTRRIKLERRGWRTGMFGWKAGAVMGGTLGKEIDVTPDTLGNWDEDVNYERRRKLDKDVVRFLSETDAPRGQIVQETDFIRIPVSSGDGYFRLVVHPSPSSSSIIAATGVFRLGSLSSHWHSASTRGASLSTLTPELALKSASNTVNSAVQSVAFTAIPAMKAVETIPGTKKLGGWALETGYRRVAGNEGQGRYRSVEDVNQHLQEKIHHVLPLENIGVRTAYDLRQDQKIGKGGVTFKRGQG